MKSKEIMPKRRSVVSSSLVAIVCAVLTCLAPAAFAQEKGAIETIDATAMGTSTQLGKNVGIKIRIERYSTDEQRKTLADAFMKGQNEGLVNALSKMPSAGRISLTGTTGYQLAFVREIPTATGRKIRFVTDRRIAFGEARNQTRSKDYSLTAGEFDLNDQDPKKSTGVLYPAAQLTIGKDGELQFELYQNPWKLQGIIDWSQKNKKE